MSLMEKTIDELQVVLFRAEAPETISRTCAQCGAGSATQQLTFHTLPLVTCFHMKYDYDYPEEKKLVKRRIDLNQFKLTIPLFINLSPFMASSKDEKSDVSKGGARRYLEESRYL